MTTPVPAAASTAIASGVKFGEEELGRKDAGALQEWVEQHQDLRSDKEKQRARQALSHLRYRLELSPDNVFSTITLSGMALTIAGVFFNLLFIVSFATAVKGRNLWTSAPTDLRSDVGMMLEVVVFPTVVVMLSTGMLALSGAHLTRGLGMLAGSLALIWLSVITPFSMLTYGDEIGVAMLIGTLCTTMFIVAWVVGGKRVNLNGTKRMGHVLRGQAAQLRADAQASGASPAVLDQIDALARAHNFTFRAVEPLEGHRVPDDQLRLRLDVLTAALQAATKLHHVEKFLASTLTTTPRLTGRFIAWACILGAGVAAAVILPATVLP